MTYLSVLIVFVALVGGGLAYVANGSMPGDALYPYKIAVDEEVEALLARSDAAKAQFYLSSIQEHMRDARTLALRGQLDASGQTEVTDATVARVRDLTALLQKLEANGSSAQAATISAQLYATLQDEVALVADASAQGSSDTQISLAPVLVTLRTTLATVALISNKAQAQAAGFASIPIAPVGNTADAAF